MTLLTVGDPAPWFTLPSATNPNYHFDTVGGHRVILFFLGSSTHAAGRQALEQFLALQPQLEATQTPFFVISTDPGDRTLSLATAPKPYCKILWDLEFRVSQQYGVCQPIGQPTTAASSQWRYRPTTFVLDENLRILQKTELQNPADHVAQIWQFVQSLPPLEPASFATRQAPALFIPNVLEPDLCQQLIHLYEVDGGRDSGFMRNVDGKTVEILDPDFKQRRDFLITEPELRQHINQRVLQRIKPEIEKAFQFEITRFERYLVACYSDSDQGFFNRHRDNTTKGTAHRRFAMTLNLNTGDYEGGCLRFPEYGSRLFRPQVGEAVIFSCSLLHEATPVTQGRRFALLSFFYNDDDARLREKNQKYVVLSSDANPAPTAQTALKANPEVEGDRPSSHTLTQSKPLGFQPQRPSKRR